MANSGYYTEPKLNATGGGSSLTIREADGTPSGVVTELVFPNTSVSIASGVGTLSVVPDSDPRLGVIWDAAINDGEVALECNNESWAFFSDPHRDNFKTALGLSTVATTGAFTDLSARPTTLSGYGITDAASSTHTHGNITNAGAIGTTADLPISTTASGVLAARTVADFRALLGLATTDSPTFAGVTLGTSGILVGGTNRIEQRNGTNAQILEIAKTWTSTTVFEELTFDASSDASNYRIGSRIGSAGGTTRGLQFGRYDAAGAWASWLGIDTSGNATFGANAQVGWSASDFITSSGTLTTYRSRNYHRFRSGISDVLYADIGLAGAGGGVSTIFYAGAAGNIVFVARGAASQSASLAEFQNSAGAILAAIGPSGDLTITPSASRTLSTNGQFTIEMTSNTAGNLVYRGSDGTTRRMALTFS